MKVIILFLVSGMVVLNVHAQSLKPGIWKVKTIFKLNGIPLPTEDDVACVTPAEAKDAKITVAKELNRNHCQIKSWKVNGKNLDARIACNGSDIEAEGVLKGTFNLKSYNLSGEAEGTYQGIIPSKAYLKLVGNWEKACPK